jgi:uncharacterized membrane protein
MGLLLAAIMSIINVLTDVARKHALDKRDLVPATFWIRMAVAAVFVLVLGARVLTGASRLEVREPAMFAIYLVVDVALITIVMWLYFRALQISPMSLCVPFLAFTPVFLIPSGWILLGEMPAAQKLLGVVLIVVGSLVMHRRLFAQGLTAPIKAVIQEKGSRYMLLVSFIFSITNPLDKKLVLLSDIYIESVAYGLGLCISFLLLGKLQKVDFQAAAHKNVKWISLAGLSDAVSLLFQLASYTYIAVVITVSIKRAGIILAVLAGWLFFHERGITDKLIASSVMFCGVLILYLPVTAVQAAMLAAGTMVGMAAALYFIPPAKELK